MAPTADAILAYALGANRWINAVWPPVRVDATLATTPFATAISSEWNPKRNCRAATTVPRCQPRRSARSFLIIALAGLPTGTVLNSIGVSCLNATTVRRALAIFRVVFAAAQPPIPKMETAATLLSIRLPAENCRDPLIKIFLRKAAYGAMTPGRGS